MSMRTCTVWVALRLSFVLPCPVATSCPWVGKMSPVESVHTDLNGWTVVRLRSPPSAWDPKSPLALSSSVDGTPGTYELKSRSVTVYPPRYENVSEYPAAPPEPTTVRPPLATV